MPKIQKSVKSLILPCASLLFLFLGAGSPTTSASLPAKGAQSEEPRTPPPATSHSLEEFCEQHWGELIEHGSYCRFAHWYLLNLKHAGARPLLTALELLPGDTLRVDSANFPEALVGGSSYDTSEEKVVVRKAGYLSFRSAPGQLLFSVERLGVERCFKEKAGRVDTAVCPN